MPKDLNNCSGDLLPGGLRHFGISAIFPRVLISKTPNYSKLSSQPGIISPLIGYKLAPFALDHAGILLTNKNISV
jgi:hypothetical protein